MNGIVLKVVPRTHALLRLVAVEFLEGFQFFDERITLDLSNGHPAGTLQATVSDHFEAAFFKELFSLLLDSMLLVAVSATFGTDE